MLGLPVTYAWSLQCFYGQFSVQMGKVNPFGQNKADKTIENTTNRDCKTGERHIGFRTNFTTTPRWVLNASRHGACWKMLREHLSFELSSLYVHKELISARVKTDLAAVERVVVQLENEFKNPWSKDSELTSLSTGIEATSEVWSNLLQAREKGLAACKKFIDERCSSDSFIDYFDSLKKQKLKTFKDLKTISKISIKDCVLPLQMDRTLFAKMAVLGQLCENSVRISPWSTSLVTFWCFWTSLKTKQSETCPATRKGSTFGWKIPWECCRHLWWNGNATKIQTSPLEPHSVLLLKRCLTL